MLVRTSRSLRNSFDRYWYFSNLSHQDTYIFYLSRKYCSFPFTADLSLLHFPSFLISYDICFSTSEWKSHLSVPSSLLPHYLIIYNSPFPFIFQILWQLLYLPLISYFYHNSFLPLLIHTSLSFDLISSRHPNSPHLLSFPLFSLLFLPISSKIWPPFSAFHVFF